jgi:hypothetical protein
MGFFGSLFGPSKDEIWKQIARDIGGEYIEDGFWKEGGLVYGHGEWEILLDTYTVTTNNGKTTSSTTYTRMRVPFANKDNLIFSLYREGFFSAIGKFFGGQDIQIGDAFFDSQFIIKGNNANQIKKLLKDDELKSLIQLQPQIHFEIKEKAGGWFTKGFPDGVNELYFQCVGVIKDTSVLKNLFELFSHTLNRLVAIDSAYEEDPRQKL